MAMQSEAPDDVQIN